MKFSETPDDVRRAVAKLKAAARSSLPTTLTESEVSLAASYVSMLEEELKAKENYQRDILQNSIVEILDFLQSESLPSLEAFSRNILNGIHIDMSSDTYKDSFLATIRAKRYVFLRYAQTQQWGWGEAQDSFWDEFNKREPGR